MNNSMHTVWIVFWAIFGLCLLASVVYCSLNWGRYDNIRRRRTTAGADVVDFEAGKARNFQPRVPPPSRSSNGGIRIRMN